MNIIEFNDYNSALFNIRTRSLNGLLYWISQIVGSLAIGFLLDQRGLSRRMRAFSGWTVLCIFVFFTHIWGYFYQKYVSLHISPLLLTLHCPRTYTRESLALNPYRMDMLDSGYPGKVMLYIFLGILDAIWQTAAYWLMGAMSNDPAKLAHFAGFCTSSLVSTMPFLNVDPFQISHCNPLVLQACGVQTRSNFRE
jgi:hypothetical protein